MSVIRSVLRSGGSGGASLTASAKTFLTSVSQGALIANLSMPFGMGTTFELVGAVPGQLALAGGAIVAGAAPPVAGQSYALKVRAISADGKREAAETFGFTAVPVLAALAFSATSFATGSAAGTLIGNIAGKTPGSALSISPNDGRVALAGDDATGWKLVVGLSAASAGTIDYIVTETLAGAAGSPRATPVTITVEQSVALPNVPLADKALRNTAPTNTRYLDMGLVSIPAGDWCLGICVYEPGGQTYVQPIFSLGNQSDTIASSNGNIILAGVFDSGQAGVQGAYALSGRDDAGNHLGNKTVSPHLGASNVPVLLGPWAPGAGGDSVMSRWWFVQKSGTEVQLWYVDPGCAPVMFDSASGNFGAIAAKRLLIGMLNTSSRSTFAHGMYFQRPFRVAKALTPANMVAIAQGVDPRQVVTFSADAGDRLWAYNGASTAGGQSFTELIAGAHGFIIGSAWYADVAPMVPQAVDAGQPRVSNIAGYGQVIQRTGVSSDLSLEGTVTGPDDDIYAQVVDWANNATVVTAWQKVATSVSGKWSGKMTGVPSAFQHYDLQLRKGLSGPVYTCKKRFTLGVVVDLWGQSLMEYFRLSGTGTITGPGAGYCAAYYSTQGMPYGLGWKRHTGSVTGYGEALMLSALSTKLACPVGMTVSAKSGSPISTWLAGQSNYTKALKAVKAVRPGHIVWNQGHGSTSDGYTLYKQELTQLRANMLADLSFDHHFELMPLGNIGDAATASGPFSSIRNAQIDWVSEQSDPKVVLAGTMMDLKLGDGIHETADIYGVGRIVDRLVETIAWKEGAVANSGDGPRFASATWISGTANIDVTFIHNGGSGLQCPLGGNVDGFEASLAADMSSPLTLNSATITGPNTVQLTLSAVPVSAPYVQYQRGRPGTDTSLNANGIMNSVDNALYDNRTPAVNGALGFPARFMPAAVRATAA